MSERYRRFSFANVVSIIVSAKRGGGGVGSIGQRRSDRGINAGLQLTTPLLRIGRKWTPTESQPYLHIQLVFPLKINTLDKE
ncbi:nop10 ribonucleoprotein isoform X2 [Temnothorax americanus]|uniref:nop10 ribonucleoprotein isoform X2 n=1 Tax=Temnothorax americanus TaxID=1964332 RepID=UPI004068525F